MKVETQRKVRRTNQGKLKRTAEAAGRGIGESFFFFSIQLNKYVQSKLFWFRLVSIRL